MPDGVSLKIINLDASWDFRDTLLTHGLDLFANAQNIELIDFTGDTARPPTNVDLSKALEPWAETRVSSEFPREMDRVKTDLQRLRANDQRYGVLFCLDWRELEEMASTLPTGEILKIEDKRGKAELETSRRSGLKRRPAPSMRSDQPKSLAQRCAAALRSDVWPKSDDAKVIWFSFFFWTDRDDINPDLAHRWLLQFDKNTVRAHSSVFLAQDAAGTLADRFTFMRSVADIIYNVPDKQDSSVSEQDSWKHLRSVDAETQETGNVWLLSGLSAPPNHSSALRLAMFNHVQKDDRDALSSMDKSKTLSDTAGAAISELDEKFLGFSSPKLEAIDAEDKFQAANARRAQSLADIDELVQELDKVNHRFDEQNWLSALSERMNNFVLARFEPLADKVRELETMSKSNSLRVSSLVFEPGADANWREDAKATVERVDQSLSECLGAARRHLANCKRLTINEAKYGANAKVGTTNLTSLSIWQEIEQEMADFKAMLRRRASLLWVFGLLIASLAMISLFFVSAVRFEGSADASVSGLIGTPPSLSWTDIFLSMAGAGPLSEKLFGVWLALYAILGLGSLLSLLVGLIAIFNLARKTRAARKAVGVRVRKLKEQLDEIVREIVLYRAKSLGAGQYNLLSTSLKIAQSSQFNSDKFGILVGQRPAPAMTENHPVAKKFTSHFFKGHRNAFDYERLASAISETIEEVVSSEAPDETGQITYTGLGRPYRAHFVTGQVSFRMERVSSGFSSL